MTSFAVGGGYIVEMLLPKVSKVQDCKQAELSLKRVKTASGESVSL